MTAEFPRSVTVYGTGLIGSSFALALRRHLPDIRINGVDEPGTIEQAQKLGIIDSGTDDNRSTDLAILAAPVGAILKLLDGLPAHHELILDVGSTKVDICRKASTLNLPFIGGHPMTGLERSGPEAASAELFENAPFFLCPIPATPPEATGRLSRLITKMGAVPHVISPEEHDELVAKLSHLPQILSTLLAEQTSGVREFAGPGWKSVTRLAASPFHVWRDILATSGFLPHELRSFVQRLQSAIAALESNDIDRLQEVFDRAKDAMSSDTTHSQERGK